MSVFMMVCSSSLWASIFETLPYVRSLSITGNQAMLFCC